MVTLVDVDAEKLSSILTSETIALVPSNSDVPVHIHEGLLGSVSPALRAASQGGWSETKSKIYKFLKDDDGFFTDVTKELLICFVRWAYIGDYTTELVGVSSFVEERIIPPLDDDDSWGYSKGKESVKNKKGKSKMTEVYIQFIEEPDRCDPPAQASTSSGLSEPSPSAKSLSPILLHVQLYVFANIYMISSLQALTKKKLTVYLQKIENSTSKDSFMEMIFDLLEHASAFLADDDALLNWLAKYAAWNLSALRQDKARLDSLLSDGKFAGLVIRHVLPSQVDPFGAA